MKNQKPKSYNNKNIHTLLDTGFKVSDLIEFCFLEPDFKPIKEDLELLKSKSEIVGKLLEYTERKGLYEPLLTWAEKTNSYRYHMYQPYQITPTIDDNDDKNDVTDKKQKSIPMMKLTYQMMINNSLLDELATCFNSQVDANILLASINFPNAYRPNFNNAGSPIEFWEKVCSQIENGRVPGGFEPLLSAAASRLPGNRKFAPFAQATPQTSMPQVLAGDYDLFLSFSSKDRALVKQIAAALTQRGLNPWFDEWSLSPGTAFVYEIGQILSYIETVVVFYGQDGYGPWQRAEVDIALDRVVRNECLLIPVMLPGVESAALPPFLRRLHSIRIGNTVGIDSGQQIGEIVDKLVSVVRS